MKLERYEIHFSDEYYEPYESDVNGDWVRWDEELEEAWDKSQPRDVYGKHRDEHSGWHIGFCPNADCSEELSQRYEKNYCSHCGQRLNW